MKREPKRILPRTLDEKQLRHVVGGVSSAVASADVVSAPDGPMPQTREHVLL